MKKRVIRGQRMPLGRLSLYGLLVTLVSSLIFVGLAQAEPLVRGFKAKGTLQPGLIVALAKSSPETIEAVPAKDSSRIYGVVVDPSQAPLTVRNQDQQAFAATGGDYQVFVSTENGNINAGDYISLSSVNGIGAKASDEQSLVLGQAVEGFDGKSGIITTDPNGFPMGRIIVSVMPGKNPLIRDDVAIPAPLKRFGNTIAGKNVSALRIYAAMLFFLVTAAVAISMLWIGIRSGMIAIGRNPLSKRSILHSLFQVVTVALLVFIVGMFGVYLLLRL